MKASFRKVDILAATVLTGLVSTAVLGQVGVGEPSLLKKVCPPTSVDVPGEPEPIDLPGFFCESDQDCSYAILRDLETDDFIAVIPACVPTPA